MADKGWIAKIVNTEGRPCPLNVMTPCPGTRKGCAFWLDEVLRDAAGSAEPQSGCLHAFQYVMHHEVVLEHTRTQAAISQHTSHVNKAAGALAKVLQLKAIGAV